jgi:hypothetical protein
MLQVFFFFTCCLSCVSKCTVLRDISYRAEVSTISFLSLNKPPDRGNIYRISDGQTGIYTLLRRDRHTKKREEPV